MDYSTHKTYFNEHFLQQFICNLGANRVLYAKEVWKCFQLSECEVFLLNWDNSINTNSPTPKED